MTIADYIHSKGIKVSNLQKDMLVLLEEDASWQQKFKTAFHETKYVLRLYNQYKNFVEGCEGNAS